MGFSSITNKVLSIKMEMCSRNILKLKFPLIACESSLRGHSKSILIKKKSNNIWNSEVIIDLKSLFMLINILSEWSQVLQDVDQLILR